MTARSWLGLFAVALVASVVAMLVREAGPIGRDISARTDLARLQTDPAAPSSGPRHAGVVMMLFTDYQCPACRLAHPHMQGALRRAGDVRVVYRDLPIFGPVSEQAARVALAAGNQGLYAQVHDAFMRDTRRLEIPVMRDIVEGLGGDWRQIEDDLARDATISEQLAENREDALRLGISGTPGYVIGPYLIIGAMDQDEFVQAFQQARDSDW